MRLFADCVTAFVHYHLDSIRSLFNSTAFCSLCHNMDSLLAFACLLAGLSLALLIFLHLYLSSLSVLSPLCCLISGERQAAAKTERMKVKDNSSMCMCVYVWC